jgi:hypothetical protein
MFDDKTLYDTAARRAAWQREVWAAHIASRVPSIHATRY